jgi:biopolymer transport protein ExbD
MMKPEDLPEPVTEINIIPVIDISLVLLVILFVTAPMFSVPNIPVSLPKSSAPKTQDPAILVTLALDGRLGLDDDQVDWGNFDAALATALKKKPGLPVVIRADKLVSYREVARVLAAAKRVGAPGIALATEGYE